MLAKLDVVTREEFDAQCALLARAQTRIAELETQINALEADNKT
jgi:BMFP domain-containing protein YqiC